MLLYRYVCNDKFNVSRHVDIRLQRSQVDCEDCLQTEHQSLTIPYQAYNLPRRCISVSELMERDHR